MKIVAFTPIKLHSERLEDKNIALLNGRPLLNYAIDTVDLLDVDNYVFCSDISVMDSVESKKVKFLERDKSLDTNKTLGNDIYDSFVSNIDADIYILYHVTSPLLEQKYYEQALHAIECSGASSAFTIYNAHTFAWYRNKPINYDSNNPPKTQDLYPVSLETSGFYIFKKESWLWHKSRIGPSPLLIEVDFWSSIDIDYQWQFDLCETRLKA